MKKEAGSIVVEVLFVVPALMLVVMLVVHAGRITQTSFNLRSVAAVSARRASQASVSSMAKVAELAARREITLQQLPCRRTTVDVAVTKILPEVRVLVRCELRIDGLVALGIRSRTVVAAATSPIDRYRHR